MPGYDIYVDGVWRTFRDRKDCAIDAARNLKSRIGVEHVRGVERETGHEVEIVE